MASIGSAGLGARVALVERADLGGDCLVHGCVPSKAILHPAHAVGALRRASELGIDVELRGVDFAFDCIGHTVTMEQIQHAVHAGEFGQSQGGTAVLVGVPQKNVELDTRNMFIGERSFISSLGGSCEPAVDFPRFLEWHAGGDLDLDSLVTQRYGIDDIGRAVEDLENGRIAGRSILVFD